MVKHYHHSTKLYTSKMSLICCHWHCYSCSALPTTNNTDTNKLVIVSGVALYYGNNYLIAVLKFVTIQITQ